MKIHRKTPLSIFALLLVVTLHANTAVARVEDQANYIQFTVERLRYGEGDAADGHQLAAGLLLATLYERRDFAPAWGDDKAVEAMLQSIRDSHLEGLNPEDYHLSVLESLRQSIAAGTGDQAQKRAEMDMLLTDALFLLAYHYHLGKIDPQAKDPDWNIRRPYPTGDVVEIVSAAIAGNKVQERLEQIKPQHYFYTRLRDTLAFYREIEKNGGWETIPEGPTLRPGMRDERVPLLRKRLALTGDLESAAAPEPELYDEALAEVVDAYQYRNGLSRDGAVGKNTLRTLNVPVGQRIDAIRVNLERARWLAKEVDPDAVVVNVAGFELYITEDERITWFTRVVVGKPYHKTPLFKGELQYIQVNPTWTVPYSIATREMLPKLKKDPTYLQSRNFVVLDKSGREVDQQGIDWSKLSRGNFPYTIRQNPGPNNALGQIKFIFPNSHAVYLHDTPSRNLFASEVRTFSHGCIRVEHPFELAARLLVNEEGDWTSEKLAAVEESGKTTNIHFKKPVSVYLTYWTAAVDDDGDVNFRADAYGRDPAVLKGLDSPFKPSEEARRRARERYN